MATSFAKLGYATDHIRPTIDSLPRRHRWVHNLGIFAAAAERNSEAQLYHPRPGLTLFRM